ncbi:MerR family transcriptional regulator [Cytobacillus sp. FJAT-54145]|uniref:MerR family transcriptional regulator n=1 Tax=Cytobacillus spartinae TaxID=3299023 RepID=A0ABW6KD87_9BACI
MYNIKKVSELVDIPTVTIRAWENRYKVISPTRTEGGHRLYSQKDIETLKWLKVQIQENNMKISEAVRSLSQNATAQKLESQTAKIETPGFDGLINQLYDALVDLNTEKANTITDLAFSMHDFEDVFQNLFVQVLYRVGDEWKMDNITAAQEHFASQFIIQRCTQFLRILPINQQLPKVVAFCPEGEHHHIGLMLFSLFLRKKGMDVIYLGPNTPFNGLIDLIHLKKISIIAISITDPVYFEGVKRWVKDCLEQDNTLSFVLGGNFPHQSELYDLPSVSLLNHVEWNDWYQGTVLKS